MLSLVLSLYNDTAHSTSYTLTPTTPKTSNTKAPSTSLTPIPKNSEIPEQLGMCYLRQSV